MDAGREAAWLDFITKMLTDRLNGLPVERIAVQLGTILECTACAVVDPTGVNRARCWIWHPAGPDRHGLAEGPRRVPEWRAFFEEVGARYHREISISVVTGQVILVLGRREPCSCDDLKFIVTVQRLLVGIDRQLRREPEVVSRSAVSSKCDDRLTPRETMVLSVMASGVTAAAAARRLEITERTVHKHLEHVYRKLDAKDRLSAVLRAKRLGLLGS